MQESWTFELKQAQVEGNLAASIADTLSKNSKELGIFLSYYTKSEGAVAENVALMGNIQMQNASQGSLQVSFIKVFFNACLNIHVDQTETMDLSFEWDAVQEQLLLKGPLIPEREPDDI